MSSFLPRIHPPSNRTLRRLGFRPRAPINVQMTARPINSRRVSNLARRIRQMEMVTPNNRVNATRPVTFNNGRLRRNRSRRQYNRRNNNRELKVHICDTLDTDLTPGINIIPIVAGKSGFPKLDALGNVFREVRLESDLQIKFVPAATTTATGLTTMAISYLDTDNINTEAEIKALEASKQSSVFTPMTIQMLQRNAQKTKPWMATSARGSHQAQNSYLVSNFGTVYVYVKYADETSQPSISGSLHIEGNFAFGAFAVGESTQQEPTPVVQNSVATAIGGDIAKQTPTATIQGVDASDNPEENFKITEPQAVLEKDSQADEITTQIELPNLSRGDEISAFTTSQMKTFSEIINRHSNTLSAYQAFQPTINFRYKDGTPIPDSIIQPVGKTASITNAVGLKHGLLIPRSQRVDLLENANDQNGVDKILSDFEDNDLFSGIFKVVGDIAKEAGPIMEFLPALLTLPMAPRSHSGGHSNNPMPDPEGKGRVELTYHIQPHGRNTNASETEDTFPLIQAATIGDSLDVLLDDPPTTNLWDHSVFGAVVPATTEDTFATKIGGFDVALQKLNGDYTVDTSNAGWVTFTPGGDSTPFTEGEIITISASASAAGTSSATTSLIFGPPLLSTFADDYVSGLHLKEASFTLMNGVVKDPYDAKYNENKCANIYTVSQFGASNNRVSVCLDGIYASLEKVGTGAGYFLTVTFARTSVSALDRVKDPEPPEQNPGPKSLVRILNRSKYSY